MDNRIDAIGNLVITMARDMTALKEKMRQDTLAGKVSDLYSIGYMTKLDALVNDCQVITHDINELKKNQ